MTIGTMTSKGQITVPQDVRDRLNLTTGTKVDFVERANGETAFIPLTGSIMDLKGILKWDGPTFTIEEMDDAIAEHLAEEDRRSRE